jgi:signal peptidase II
MVKQRKYLILVSAVGLIVSLDQLTKIAITERFKLGETKQLLDHFFNFTLVHNPGAAFGMLANLDPAIREPFFLAVPVITLAIILFAFFRLPAHRLLSMLSLSSIVGGAIGNLIDRLRVGYVIDFLDFHWHYGYHFPAFNVADSAISLGVFLLLIEMILEETQKRKANA